MPFVINVNSLMHFLDIPKMLLSSQLGYFNVVFDHYELNISQVVPSIRFIFCFQMALKFLLEKKGTH